LILENTSEHLYKSDTEPMEVAPIGAYLLRGDSVALISKVERIKAVGDIFGDPLPAMQLS